MKKTLVILLSILTISCWAQPAFVWENKDHSFGHILNNSEDLYVGLYFCNLGKDTLYINRILPTRGITVIDWSKDGVAFDETGFLELKLDPSNFPLGKFSKAVYLYNNSETQLINISGTVITEREFNRQKPKLGKVAKIAKKKDLYADEESEELEGNKIEVVKEKKRKRKKRRKKKDREVEEEEELDNKEEKEKDTLDASNHADLDFEGEE